MNYVSDQIVYLKQVAGALDLAPDLKYFDPAEWHLAAGGWGGGGVTNHARTCVSKSEIYGSLFSFK